MLRMVHYTAGAMVGICGSASNAGALQLLCSAGMSAAADVAVVSVSAMHAQVAHDVAGINDVRSC